MDSPTFIYHFLQSCHHIDKEVTLAINSMHCPWSDSMWLFFSNREVWYIMYLIIVVFLFRNLGWRRATIGVISIILTVLCCDQLSNLSKDFFERLRPFWDEEMLAGGLNNIGGGGDKYGFFSAHAANAVGIALCSVMVFRNDRTRKYRAYTICIFTWAFLVSISRVFIGKHFLGDVLTGIAVGAAVAFVFGKLSSIDIPRTYAGLCVLLYGHILNPLWHTRVRRRERREQVKADVSVRYFSRNFMSRPVDTPADADYTDNPDECIYSLWLQGEENAPDLVKSCLASVRRNCRQRLVVLDEKQVIEMTHMPETIIRKYRQGIISPAQFSDICRVDLLYRYGGYWIDATCFVTAPIPAIVGNSDFFVYLAGNRCGFAYSFIQSCFIRARKGEWLTGSVRNMIIDYWEKENSLFDYFQLHLMFKTIVETTERGARIFADMPKIDQYGTHMIFHKGYTERFDRDEFEELTSKAFFQKMSHHLKTWPSGSYIDVISKGNIV